MYDIGGICENIRFYRKKIGFSQTELGDRLGLSFQAISSWERGETLPDIDNLCRLAMVLGVTVDTLLKRNILHDETVMLGIDGGNTKTDFVLFTSSGRVLTAFSLAGSSAHNYGLNSAIEVFRSGIDRCLNEYGNIKGIFIGTAGGSQNEIANVLSKYYSSIRFKVVSDGVNALSCAEGDAALICSSGSLLIAKSENGYRLFGGWGHRMGDAGSAYSIAREAIRNALAVEDGLVEQTMLYSILLEKLGMRKVHGELADVPYAAIARHASVVFTAFLLGDPIAKRILENEMKALADMLNKACTIVGNRVIVCGGVMRAQHDILLPMLKEYIHRDICFVLPELPPVYGACLECCRFMEIEPSDNFFENFAEDYRRQVILLDKSDQ